MTVPEDSAESAYDTIDEYPSTESEPTTVDSFEEDFNRFLKKTQNEFLLNDLHLKLFPDDKPRTPWPPFDWHPTTRLPRSAKDEWVMYNERFNTDWIKHEEGYHFHQFETDFKIPEFPKFPEFPEIPEIREIKIQPYIPPTPAPLFHTPDFVYRALAGMVGGFFVLLVVLFLITNACEKKHSRSGTVTGAGSRWPPAPARGVQPARQRACPPPGAVLPNIDLPPSFSECISESVSEPPPYTDLAETVALIHNCPVEIGFRTAPNDSKHVETELVFDNGRIVESLSLDLNKETSQAARTSGGTDSVVYVDEKSTP